MLAPGAQEPMMPWPSRHTNIPVRVAEPSGHAEANQLSGVWTARFHVGRTCSEGPQRCRLLTAV
eukprot:4278945-Alexandrium_andersonii.AAC.1